MDKINLTWLGIGTALLFTFVFITPVAFAQEETAPVEIKLPKAMFIGTPKPVNTNNPNFESSSSVPRPPFMAPKGVYTVSAGKPVIASDSEPVIGDLNMLTDGDKEGADGSYVEFGPGVQWVQIDLGVPMEIYAIVTWHYHSQARVYKDFIVRVSDDPDFVKGVMTVYNNDHDNSAGLGVGTDKEYTETHEGRLVDAKGMKARYVRLYSNGNTSNDMNHYIEVEVYGRPAK